MNRIHRLHATEHPHSNDLRQRPQPDLLPAYAHVIRKAEEAIMSTAYRDDSREAAAPHSTADLEDITAHQVTSSLFDVPEAKENVLAEWRTLTRGKPRHRRSRLHGRQATLATEFTESSMKIKAEEEHLMTESTTPDPLCDADVDPFGDCLPSDVKSLKNYVKGTRQHVAVCL